MIEPTVTWGNLIGIASVVLGCGALFWRLTTYHAQNAARLAAMETKVDSIWNWFTNRLERRDMRRGDYEG